MKLKANLSGHHFISGQFFSEKASEIEAKYSRESVDADIEHKHRAYVLASIGSLAFGLEALINEIFLDACDSPDNLRGLDSTALSMLCQYWDFLEDKPTLVKYQTALWLSGKSIFDRGKAPYQDADHLMKLRNNLVHYKPEWSDDEGQHQKIYDRLGSKFPENPFTDNTELWFPRACLSAGCANWALSTARSFVTEFCDRMAIERRIL